MKIVISADGKAKKAKPAVKPEAGKKADKKPDVPQAPKVFQPSKEDALRNKVVALLIKIVGISGFGDIKYIGYTSDGLVYENRKITVPVPDFVESWQDFCTLIRKYGATPVKE